MIDYKEISETDATKVARVRKAEIRMQLNKLNEILGTTFHGQENVKMNWSHVGSLSRMLEVLEDVTSSYGKNIDENELREQFGLKNV